MNHEINLTLPKISDFPYLNESFLDRFGAAYMPDMSRSEIKACQKYYLRHRRAPSGASELAFLNALALKKRREPSTFLIAEMTTDDAFLAETFADLMAKRAAVTPDYRMPCSLSEIPQIAQKYLVALDPERTPTGRLALSAAPDPMLALCAKRIQPTPVCRGFAGGLVPSRAFLYGTPLKENDTVYALLKSTDPTEGFEEKLLRFADSQAARTHIKQLYPIANHGVLGALTSLGKGFEADLVRLYGEKTAATRLLDEEVGLLFVVKDADAATLLMDALDMGLRPRLVGHVRADERVRIWEDADTCLGLSLHFLDTFVFARAYRAEISLPVASPLASLEAEETTCKLGNKPLFFARVSTDASRNAALYAALHAIAACVARGLEPRDVRVAARTSLSLADTAPETVGNDLALLLGYYRAVTEFELLELDSAVLTAKEKSTFSLCAVTPEPEHPIPRELVSQSSHIYLLEPAYDQNGNPDFEDIKKMLEYVGKLQRDDKILSARAVSGDVLPTLAAMSESSLVEYLPDGPRTAYPGSILVETKAEIRGTLLAKTCVPAPMAQETE